MPMHKLLKPKQDHNQEQVASITDSNIFDLLIKVWFFTKFDIISIYHALKICANNK